MSATFRMDNGLKKLRGRLEAILDETEQAGVKGLREFGKMVITESQLEVPIQTGTLHDSAYVDRMRRRAHRKVVINIGYGGPRDKVNPLSGRAASDYGLQVHEDLSAFHPTGKAKFLEDPLRRLAPRMPEFIAAAIRRVRGGRKGG